MSSWKGTAEKKTAQGGGGHVNEAIQGAIPSSGEKDALESELIREPSPNTERWGGGKKIR